MPMITTTAIPIQTLIEMKDNSNRPQDIADVFYKPLFYYRPAGVFLQGDAEEGQGDKGRVEKRRVVKYKHLKLDQNKIDFAMRYFGVDTEQKAVDMALSVLMEEEQIVKVM